MAHHPIDVTVVAIPSAITLDHAAPGPDMEPSGNVEHEPHMPDDPTQRTSIPLRIAESRLDHRPKAYIRFQADPPKRDLAIRLRSLPAPRLP